MSHSQKTIDWEVVIGLEIHAELNTKTKLFSRAPNHFGDEPNTNITEICTGQPGSLPILNKEAVRKAVQLGCAVRGEIAKWSQFDRKSYFYPDLPRNFQITQYTHPIISGGTVIAELEGREIAFALDRIHLEDDTGTMKHFSRFVGVDYNRSGVPLVEIVSKPCMHSAKEAVAYAMAIKAILQYLDVSDCNMDEGSLRMDANVSIRPRGDTTLRTKTEIKNVNSFSNMEMAIGLEIARQKAAYEAHPHLPYEEVIHQETYRWDPSQKNIILMRKKEYAADYRYFPEPDLVPIILTDAYIEEIRKKLPELPLQRERRYVYDLGLHPDLAFFLVSEKTVADYFERALPECVNPRSLCNWILIEFGGRLKESGKTLVETGIPPSSIAQLVNKIEKGSITGKIGKKIADELLSNPELTVDAIIAKNPNYQPLVDEKVLEKYVDEVIRVQKQSIRDYLGGRDRAFGFLVGQVMKLSHGKASPEHVNRLLKEKIAQWQDF